MKYLFDTSGFPARWDCGDWTSLHGWVHISADFTIFLAYMAIPGSIAYFMWKHRELHLPKLGWLFVAFIFSCGFTHLVETSLFWHPWYRFSGLMKIVTALVSMATVVAIYRKLPDLRKIPGLQRLISERTRELRESEERSRLVIDSVRDYAILMLDPKGNVVTWNSGAERIKGYASEEIIGRNFAIFYPAEDLEHQIPQKELENARETGHIQSEGWRIRKDGSRFYASVILTAALDDAGKLRGFSNVTRDITEQKLAKNSEKLAAERLQLATKVGEVGIWDWAVHSNSITINEQFALIYGLGPGNGAIATADFVASVHPADQERIRAMLQRVLRNAEKSFDTEFRIIRRDNADTRIIHAVATVFFDESGNPVRIAGTNFDVTDERIRERDLAIALESQKDLTRAAQAGEHAKSEFLAVMSHEIRTPMNGILGFAEILANSPTLSAEDRISAQTIATSGRSLLRILNDVLDFSRLGAGQLTTQNAAYSPRKLLDGIHALFLQQIRNKGLEFPLIVAEDVPAEVIGDEGRVRQVLLNLIGNALKFIERGTVTLEVRRHQLSQGNTSLEFLVTDTGPGIPEDQVDSIFDAFHQTDSTLARRHGGAGLGLTISRGLAILMGGTLDVRSRVAQGSAFSLRVPFSVPGSTTRPANSPPVLDKSFAAAHPLDLLIVEDDGVNLRLVELITRKLGYNPRVARNGLEAITRYREARPDCILMDIQMPEMDGIEATRQIRLAENQSTAPAIYIAALTANTVPKDRQRSLDAGMNAFLNKPIQRAELVRILQNASRASGGASGA